jgi:hypothetical protein
VVTEENDSGNRLRPLWRSWDWAAERWAPELSDRGAKPVFCRPLGRTGQEGDRSARELIDLVAGLDAAIVGLGNCGSCTQWTIKDAHAAADQGSPQWGS